MASVRGRCLGLPCCKHTGICHFSKYIYETSLRESLPATLPNSPVDPAKREPHLMHEAHAFVVLYRGKVFTKDGFLKIDLPVWRHRDIICLQVKPKVFSLVHPHQRIILWNRRSLSLPLRFHRGAVRERHHAPDLFER